MKDQDFLRWLADRLVNRYEESENLDFVQKLRAVAEVQPPEQDTQWSGIPVATQRRVMGNELIGGPPFLDEHLTYEYRCNDPDEFARMVQTLLDTNTCFAVIGGANTLRFHDRGAQALGLDLAP